MSNATQTENEIKNLTNKINKVNQATEALKQNTLNRQRDISDSLSQLNEQRNLLEQKRNILLTRNRMLQLSQDRNIYKQKVIYTILALIITCLILVLIGYTAVHRR